MFCHSNHVSKFIPPLTKVLNITERRTIWCIGSDNEGCPGAVPYMLNVKTKRTRGMFLLDEVVAKSTKCRGTVNRNTFLLQVALSTIQAFGC